MASRESAMDRRYVAMGWDPFFKDLNLSLRCNSRAVAWSKNIFFFNLKANQISRQVVSS
jgi:hypothetical protein